MGATATFTLTVQVQASTPLGATLTNLGSVSQDPLNVDTTLANNRVTLDTVIQVATLTPTATATSTVTATPTATPTRIAGDFNGDGFLDIRDYGVWRLNFGQTNCGNPTDGDGNCLVDIRDYGSWRLHFGEGTPPDRRRSGPLPVGNAPAPRSTPGPAPAAGDPAGEASGRLLPADGSGGGVPVLPLVGGLVGLGGLAGWRARGHPSAE